jgi:hypothetical protein
MKFLTSKDIDLLESLYAASTPGEWEVIADSFDPPEWFMIVRSGNKLIVGPTEPMIENPDFVFITAAHNAMALLLFELRNLREFEHKVGCAMDAEEMDNALNAVVAALKWLTDARKKELSRDAQP